MEKLDVCRRLTGTMESESSCCVCCCGEEEESLHQINIKIQLLHLKETRLQRQVQLLLAGMLLLVSVTLPLLLLRVFDGSHEHIIQNESHSPGISSKQHQSSHSEHPSVLLTAVSNYSTAGGYLEWEYEKGNAHCDGGFNYSKGDLTVPRAGKYSVYLQITYESYESWTCEEYLFLEHWVYCHTKRYPKDVPLMSADETVNCSWNQFKKSLYTSAVFFLEASDILRVKSKNPEFIVQKEDKVFFGAELVNEQPAGIT